MAGGGGADIARVRRLGSPARARRLAPRTARTHAGLARRLRHGARRPLHVADRGDGALPPGADRARARGRLRLRRGRGGARGSVGRDADRRPRHPRRARCSSADGRSRRRGVAALPRGRGGGRRRGAGVAALELAARRGGRARARPARRLGALGGALHRARVHGARPLRAPEPRGWNRLRAAARRGWSGGLGDDRGGERGRACAARRDHSYRRPGYSKVHRAGGSPASASRT